MKKKYLLGVLLVSSIILQSCGQYGDINKRSSSDSANSSQASSESQELYAAQIEERSAEHIALNDNPIVAVINHISYGRYNIPAHQIEQIKNAEDPEFNASLLRGQVSHLRARISSALGIPLRYVTVLDVLPKIDFTLPVARASISDIIAIRMMTRRELTEIGLRYGRDHVVQNDIVAAFYAHLLGREPDAAGREFYNNQVRNGRPVWEIIKEIELSYEAMDMSESFSSGTENPIIEQVNHITAGRYTLDDEQMVAAENAIDKEGVANTVGNQIMSFRLFVARGMNIDVGYVGLLDIMPAIEFYAPINEQSSSDPYYAVNETEKKEVFDIAVRAGSNDLSKDLLSLSYYHILNRVPDYAGYEHYTRQINSGRALWEVVKEIELSEEAIARGY